MLNHLFFFIFLAAISQSLCRICIGSTSAALRANADNALHIYSGRRIGSFFLFFVTRSHLCEPISAERSELPVIRL